MKAGRVWVVCVCALLAETVALGQGSKVSFRDDQTVLVEGQPFFPIGLYYCHEDFADATGRLLKELRDLGFNTLDFYRWGEPTWKEELDRVHKAGLKVWVRGVNGFSVDSPEVEKSALEQVRALRGHPALLFWEFQDEPLLNKVSIENSRKGQELVKREDPDHPLLTVEWPGAVSRIKEWKLGDLYGFDLYPIPRRRKYGRLANHDITQIGDYADTIRQARGDSPMVMVLQAWSWDPVKYGKEGYPTPTESRFMAYQAVIHGVKAIFYYGQVHCTKPNSAAALSSASTQPAVQQAEFAKCLELNAWFWEQHRPFFRELGEAAAIFVLREAPKDDRITPAGPPGHVESLTKQADADLYLLAVNADGQPCEATFQLPQKRAGATSVHVLFENRTVAVKDGNFTDKFQPYDTHVYATTPRLPGGAAPQTRRQEAASQPAGR